MSRVADTFVVAPDLVLGKRLNQRVSEGDQLRQRAEVEEILRRLRKQPGVVLADEVGMGKTFVALGIAYSVAACSPQGPVIIMVPPNLVGKWEQDLKTFCELYVDGRVPVDQNEATQRELRASTSLRYGVARHSIELLRLLDDHLHDRCHLIFLAQGALGRSQGDKWIRLALIAEALRRHATGKANRLIQVKKTIHRYLGKLLWAVGEERAHGGGTELWQQLLRSDPASWRATYNREVGDQARHLRDDPVPKSVMRAINRIDLKELAEELRNMPLRESGGDRVGERVADVRTAINQVERWVWAEVLRQARWRSPLLVMDEAHHLKNPRTLLARQLQSSESEEDLKLGDGAMANAFDRMLFLTATPFQLGHRELVRVLERFGDVRWNADKLGDQEGFRRELVDLSQRLDDSQRSAIALQRAWARLREEDCPDPSSPDPWWAAIRGASPDSCTHHQRAVIEAFDSALQYRTTAQVTLYPWLVRHDKGQYWPGSNSIVRRVRQDGAAISGGGSDGGLLVPPDQLLAFFLAARSAIRPGHDLLGEALSSSYEAFRDTRRNRKPALDEQEQGSEAPVDLSRSSWYLEQFDDAIRQSKGTIHPKITATVARVVDLWEAGEKVLVFAFYRHTVRALRRHISDELERRLHQRAQRAYGEKGMRSTARQVDQQIVRIQRRYFDDKDSPGRRAINDALAAILDERRDELVRAGMTLDQEVELLDVMRRFLRVPTTLIRCFPLTELDTMEPADAVRHTLGWVDGSNMAWRSKLAGFVKFLCQDCSRAERQSYLDAASRMQTGSIRVEGGETGATTSLANIQVATGDTERAARERLMRAFNTPFFPDILVCSEVMGEGVDLQRFCRHVIHHDLAWNPSTIEQRTGRIDRLGCKAEGKQSICVYLPYLSGAADERQYQVMSERERWFRVVMGQDEVAKLITPDASNMVPLPFAIGHALQFDLSLR